MMLAFQSGDSGAFVTLCRRNRSPVYNFIFRFVQNRQGAEDVLQETWLKVIRHSRDYEVKAKFSTWLYTIARNLCVDYARRHSTQSEVSLDVQANANEEGDSLAQHLADEASPLPDRSSHQVELRSILQKAVASIPIDQREVFMLRQFHGLSFQEIAAVVGANENTVKSRMRYALEGLRTHLREAGVDGELMTFQGKG